MTRRIISGRNAVRFVKDPPPGEKGDSLVSFTVYFKLTRTLEPPSTLYVDEAHGWYATTSASCPRAATAEYPFLWEYDVYVFDNESLNKQVLKLAQTMQPDIRPNLLEQTAFEPGYMDKWQNVGHSEGAINVDVHNGHNAYGHMPIARWQDGSQNWYNYYNMLAQRVMNDQEGWTKLKGDSWYTLSFWARTRIYENATSNNYGFNWRTLYLHPGHYRLTINGRCSADAITKGNSLACFVWAEDNQGHWISGKSRYVLLTDTVDTTKSAAVDYEVTAEDEANYVFKIGFYAYRSDYNSYDEQHPYSPTSVKPPLGDVTINWWKLEDMSDGDHGLLNVYCYSSTLTEPLMPGATFFVDGKVMEHAQEIDGCTAFHLADDEGDSEGWTRHWVAWRTKQVIPEAIQNVLWRGFRTYVEISQPKLEEGIMPTDWCPNDNDPELHYSHNPAGTWVSGRRYYYYNGIRDVVRAVTTVGGNQWAWFRMKKRTDANGYLSQTEPCIDTTWWEEATNLRFVMVEAMFAEEIFTDKLTVSKIIGHNNNFVLNADGSVSAAGGNFTIDAAGNIKGKNFYLTGGEFGGAIRSPYQELASDAYSDNDTLSLNTYSCWMVNFAGANSSSVRNLYLPSPQSADSNNNPKFNGLEVRILRPTFQPNQGILRIHIPAPWSDNNIKIRKNNYDAELTIDLWPGQELVLKCAAKKLLSGAWGIWIVQNGRDRINDYTYLKLKQNNARKYAYLVTAGNSLAYEIVDAAP